MFENIQKDGQLTHMPFVFSGPGGGQVMLYCRTTSLDWLPSQGPRRWKLWIAKEDGSVRRFETHLPTDIVECSPAAWYDECGWHVTFIAGARQGGWRYKMYRMDGETLDTLCRPFAVQATRSGFQYLETTVTASPINLIQVRNVLSGEEFDLELPGCRIGRVSYMSQKPHRMIIGAMWLMDGEGLTIEYDTYTDTQNLLLCDGQPAYKPCMHGSTVWNSEKSGDGGELRHIKEVKKFQRKSTNIVMRRPPDSTDNVSKKASCGGCGAGSIDLGPNTRPSCLECVEKHLGAVYVLLTECRDGYAHRLRAVGHFHEAEDESQAWSGLHLLIRASRKAFQKKGTIPEWQLFEDHVREIRDRMEKDGTYDG